MNVINCQRGLSGESMTTLHEIEQPTSITREGTASQGMQWYVDAMRWFAVYPETADIQRQLKLTIKYTTGWPAAYVEQTREAEQILEEQKYVTFSTRDLFSLVMEHNNNRIEPDAYTLSAEFLDCSQKSETNRSKLLQVVEQEKTHLARIQSFLSYRQRRYGQEKQLVPTVYAITDTDAVLSDCITTTSVYWVKFICQRLQELFGSEKMYTFTFEAMQPKRREARFPYLTRSGYVFESTRFLAEIEKAEHKWQQMPDTVNPIIVRNALAILYDLRQVHEERIRVYNEEQRKYNQRLLEFGQNWIGQ